MSARKRGNPARFRVGRVSVYSHHGTWWLYFREAGKPVRQRVGKARDVAEQEAASINARLTRGEASPVAFRPTDLPTLRRDFLDYHESFLKSSVATIRRYRAATQHLENFAGTKPAHEINPVAFAGYLRNLEVSPNGHANTERRSLRDKGIQFILETCRAMYSFAGRQRHLPAYSANPFAELPLDRLKIEDAKPIFVFEAETERLFLEAASDWAFPIHFTLAKTGLRVGELTHLLIDNLDLEGGWLHVRNKLQLGWRIKTGNERTVPLIPEAVNVLRVVIGSRRSGPVFIRPRFVSESTSIVGGSNELERVCRERQERVAKRADRQRVARIVWQEAGAVDSDAVRTSFIRIARSIGRPEATCPKSWRHTFATLLQDSNVDPLIRQITLGHKPTVANGLGMTANYTHTRPETQHRQIESALRQWPLSLKLASDFAARRSQCS